MAGIYVKISRLTPLREVKVLVPVKFKATKAVTAGIASRNSSAWPTCPHQF